MHKALAKAWRDLGHTGQKPYFTEYDRSRERYKEECAELGITPGGASTPSHGKRGPRATSATSSVAPTALEAEAVSPQGSANEEEDAGGGGSSTGGFTAVNR